MSLALLALTCGFYMQLRDGQHEWSSGRKEHASLTSCQLSLCASRVTTPSLPSEALFPEHFPVVPSVQYFSQFLSTSLP